MSKVELGVTVSEGRGGVLPGKGHRRAFIATRADAAGRGPQAGRLNGGERTSLWDVRVLMVLLTGFCVFLNVYATQTLLPLLARVFHASKFEVSLTVSASTIGIAVAAPLVGLLAERIGRKQTMAWSVTVLTLPILLAATSPNLHALIGWRFAQGLVMPGIIAVTMAYVSEEWPSGGTAAVMSAYVAGNVLGGVTGRFLSGVLADHFGWQVAFVVLGAMNAVGAAAVWRWLPASRNGGHAVDFKSSLRAMGGHLRRPEMLATFGVGMASLFVLVASFTYITFYLAAAPFNLGTMALGSLFLVYLVGVVVTPIAGQWIERVGHRAALVGAAAVSAAGVGMTLVHALPVVVAGLALCSTGIFVCQSATASYLGHVAGRGKASAAGLYTTFYYAGGTIGASAPALAWAWGGWPACVGLICVAMGVAAGLALGFWRPVGHAGAAVPADEEPVLLPCD